MDASKKRKADENGTVITTDQPETLTQEDSRKLLEPFTHEQLLTLLTTAVTTHPDLLSAARAVADADVSRRKLFVRGLGPETTTDSLKSLFSSYGELEEAVVITDKATAKSKGYGFVTFKHVDGALLALRQPSKRIDGRMTVTHLASAGRAPSGEDQATRKIYIGNVPYEVSAERLLDYFLVFGDIEEGPLGFDKQGGKTRGFAFFVYKTEEGARCALMEPMKVIDGHTVMCKLAEDGKKGKVGIPMGNNSGPIGEGMGDRMGQNPMNSSYGPPSSGNYSSYGPGPGSMGGQPGGGAGYTQQIGGAYNAGLHFGGPGSGDFGSYRMPPPVSMPPPSGGPYSQESGGGYTSGYMGHNAPPPQGPPGPMYQRMPPYF
ncbi:UBP1-associated protein 2C-like [Silene latifolia]|uniref:UBP1-associated protein 2C-like n=1 Tax=Silene latifolia TaxID=37657 RepID=UPI003D789B59